MTVPIILALDTCERHCSVAIVRGEDVLAERSEEIGRGHAERLLPLLDEVMAEGGAGFPDLTRLAVCTGPGTFTGLRIGLAVGRGLALACQVPCVGLTSLTVLAAQAFHSTNETTAHAVVMGRGGQGFHQAFSRAQKGRQPIAITAAASLDAEAIALLVEDNPGVVVGSGASLIGYESAISALSPKHLAFLGAQLKPADHPPEPAYLRAADAAKAKKSLPVEQ